MSVAIAARAAATAIATADAPTAVNYFEAGRRAVWILVNVTRGDLAEVERIIRETEAALTPAQRPTGSKYILTMRSALRQLTHADAVTRGKLGMGVAPAAILREIEAAEATARVEGYLSPRLANDFRAQRWALEQAVLLG